MFKFYTIPSCDIIDRLVGSEATIKLSSAFNLNDPYELKFNLELDPLAKDHEKHFYDANPHSNADDFKNWQKHVAEYGGYNWYAEQRQRDAIAKSIAVCSFALDNKSNLMWSHYTNNHQGICVEYAPDIFEYFKTLSGYLLDAKVNYSDEPPYVNYLEDNNSKVEKIMFNKQSEWKYEKEHRVVFCSDKDTEFLTVDRKYIKSVFIGSRADNELEKKILSVCGKTHIDIYNGLTLGKSYSVHFEKHKDRSFYVRAFW